VDLDIPNESFFPKKMRWGSRGPAVGFWIIFLITSGNAPNGTINDFIFGENAQLGTRNLQVELGLEETGVVDAHLFEAIRRSKRFLGLDLFALTRGNFEGPTTEPPQD